MPKLTNRTIAALKPARSDVFAWDDELPGFGVRLKSTGAAAFLVQYRNSRRQSRRLTIGRVGVIGADEARRKARKLMAEIQDGADPAAARRDAREAATVAEFAERYLAEHAVPKKKASSVRSDQFNLRLHVLPALGRKAVADLTRADISGLHYAMRATPGAANRVLSLLSKMLNLAEKWGIRPDGSNPCRHVERYRERKMERFLSGEELARLGATLASLENSAAAPSAAIAAIRLLVFTGARLGEIIGLRWEHVDFERTCLRLPDSKTGAKTIYLAPPALTVLRSLGEAHQKSAWVIPGRQDGKAPLATLHKTWGRVRRAADLADVRLHDLRHSFASVGAAGGLSLPIIGALLGHRVAQTTARYAHLAASPVQNAANLIGERIAAAMAGGSADPVPLTASRTRRA